jgi:hypothetical protein
MQIGGDPVQYARPHTRVNKFGAFCRNSTDSVRLEFKNSRITVHKLKKTKNKKKSGKICKKLDEILRLLVKKIFQIGIVWLVKI